MLNRLREVLNRTAAPPKLPQKHLLSAPRTTVVANALLQDIVQSVVEGLNFRASMISVVDTLDGKQILKVHAFAYASPLSKLKWLDAGKKLQGTVLEIGESIAGQKLIGNYVSLDETENLGVRVIREQRQSDRTKSLYELFAPRIDEEIAEKLQILAQLHEFVTIPFRDDKGNLIGNLFAGTDRLAIADQEIESLKAFSKMAAIAIQNAQLLQESEALHNERQARLVDFERKNRQLSALQDIMNALLESTLSEHKVLQKIVNGVVAGFGFRAAMLSVVDRDEKGRLILPVRAFSIDPTLPGHKILEEGQRLIGKSLIGAYVCVDEETKKDNLGVRVILDRKDSGRARELRELWYPAASANQCAIVQRALGINALATIPFWLIDRKTGEKNIIGNLYVGTDREEITDDELKVLGTFALQASNAIRNAELYLDAQRIASIGSLTSNMAHRLNGIIGKVGVWVEKIPQKIERHELDDTYIHRISENLKAATGLVAKLREKAKEDVEISLVNVNEVLESTLSSMDIPQGIMVEKRLDKNLPLALVVRQHLSEAFGILINNAVEAIGDSGKLTFTTQRVQNCIEILVKDTGRGIPDKVMSSLFTLGETTKKHGLGFGLYWVRTSLGWVEGDIKVESKEGAGSVFTISLPVPETSSP